MGVWSKVEPDLNEIFSIQQFMTIMGMDKNDKREARNILNQFFESGKIYRLSKNLYKKKN
ncbi:MAG: hypothetical protein ACTSVY_01125 [Candidatus Helarchaeota archaeon]